MVDISSNNRSHRFTKILWQPPRDSFLTKLESMQDIVEHRFTLALRESSDMGKACSDIALLFTDHSLIRTIADEAIFRGRTNAVFQHGRDFYDVYERSANAYDAAPRKPALRGGLTGDHAKHLIATVVTHAAERFAVTSLPSGTLVGNKQGVQNPDDVILSIPDLTRVLYESSVAQMVKDLPTPRKVEGALPVDEFSRHLRDVCAHIVRKTTDAVYHIEGFRNAVAYAKYCLFRGVPFGVNAAALFPLMDYVNVAIDETIDAAAPSNALMHDVNAALGAVMSLISINPTISSMEAAEFPAYYRRFTFKVDRTEKYAPVILTRNYPQIKPSGTKLVVHAYVDRYGVHSITRAGQSRSDITLDQDISLVDEENLLAAVSLIAERREFTGLISTVNGRELRALAYCLAADVEFTVDPSTPDQILRTFNFRGPRLNDQLARVMDDSPNYENSTSHVSVIVAYALYDFGRKAFPAMTSVAELLAEVSTESIEVFAPKKWKPILTDGSAELEVQGYYVKVEEEVAVGPPEETEGDDAGASDWRPSRDLLVEHEYTGRLSINSAMGVTSSYPTVALRPIWARQLEMTRAQIMLGIYAILVGDSEIFRASGLHIYAFDNDGNAVTGDGPVSRLLEDWSRDDVQAATARTFLDVFREPVLRLIKTQSVVRGVSHVVRTGKGHDRMPLNMNESAAYVKTRLNVASALTELLHSKESPPTLLASAILRDPEIVQWLTSRILVTSKGQL